MKLYGNPFSYNCRKVETTLRHLDLPFEFELIDFARGQQRGPELSALNPNQKVPVLVVEGLALWESTAIIRYLAGKHRPALLGGDLDDRFEVDRWLTWQVTEFGPATSAVGRTAWIMPMLTGQPADPVELARVRAELAPKVPILENRLSGRDWLATELSLADIALGVVADVALGVHPEAFADAPNIKRWQAALHATHGWVPLVQP